MYPWFRLGKEVLKFRKSKSLGIFDTHVSHHICWPWDIDPWMELNNGRTLTLYDLGRVPMGLRLGLGRLLKEKRWGLAVAGASIRYRRRIHAFQRFQMRSKVSGWDEKFIYIEQSMWRKGDCCSHVLIRGAMTRGKSGIVPPLEVMQTLGQNIQSPPLPEWIKSWIVAEAQRPWPPMSDSFD